MKKFPKKLLALMLAFAVTASTIPMAAASSFSYDEMSGHFSVESYEITEVAPGASYMSLDASNASGKQSINAIEFDPKNPYTQLRAGKSQGYVWSTQTVNTIATNMSNAENGGDVAVAAINGDFFTFGIGVPQGVFIDEGIILSTPPQYCAAFGITYDNEPFIIRHGTILDKLFRLNGSYVNIAGINIAHAKNSESIVLYTADYARGTKNGSNTYEVRCRVNSGEVRHDSTVNFTVEEINDSVGDTALGKGYIVFSAQGESSIATLKQLTVGSTHEITFRFNEFWSNVKFAVGGDDLLLKDGEVYSTTDKTNQPRTSIGIRPDGTVVMATFDGRGAGGAVGMSYKTAAEAMRALGCVDALNLDGGGSTTFVLRTPGSMKTDIVNNISGSSPRQVANALVLMNTAPTLAPTSLTVAPKTKLCFVGGKYSFSVTSAYDTNYKPHPIPSVIWETDSEDNLISEKGELSANAAGKVTVSAISDSAIGSAEVEIVDRADTVKVSEGSLTVKPGETFELSASATLGGKSIEAYSALFRWEAPESLGKFTSPGKFKVDDNAISGDITVSLGGASSKVKVTVETPPVAITGFEDNSVSFVPVSVGTKTAPSVKLESILRYAHTGDRSMKAYYNFIGTSGTAGSYYMVANDSINNSAFYLRRAPKQLAMMVYGDGSGVELRSIVEETSGKQHTISYGKIDHTGWKYMTANLPSGISGTVYVKVPVYLLSNPQKATSGVIYFDGLAAIYNEKNLDTTSPAITKVWPSDGEKITTTTPTFGIILSDASGIDQKTIELYVDGVLCDNVEYNTSNGKISCTVKEPLSVGAHSLMLFVRDKVGNPVFHKCGFEV